MLEYVLVDNVYFGYFWIVVAIFFMFMELISPGLLFFLSFSVGAFCSAVLAFFGYSLVVQCIFGLVMSVASFFAMKQFLKYRNLSETKGGRFSTNVDALVGKKGVAISDIKPTERGFVKVEGEVWSAFCENVGIKKDVIVTVVRVKGNSLIVKE